jgi:hypothetical protein
LVYFEYCKGEQLYYCKDKENRLVIKTEEGRNKLLVECHDKSGHQGITRTQKKVVEKYYWLTISEDVTN